jgi:PAS domain S-box-containing protein
MMTPSRPPQKGSDPAQRNSGSSSTPAESERLVDVRTAELRHELEEMRRQNEELKKVEAAFRERENQLKLALESAGAGMWIRDPDGGWIATRELNALFGRSPDDPPLREEEILPLIHPDDLPDLRNAWRAAIDHGSDYRQEYRVIWPDGSVHWLASKGRVSPESGVHRFSGITYDITGQKRIEDTLIDREEELQNLIESSRDGIVIIDHEGRITTWNTGAEIITGLAARDVVGVPAWEIQSRCVSEEWAGPDPRTKYRGDWDRLLRDDTDPHLAGLFDAPIRTPEGDIRYIQQNVFKIPTRHGFRIGCILRDITEGKKVEESLRVSEDKFRKLVQSTPDGILLNDDQGVILEWNTGMEEIFGLPREDAIGKTLSDVASRIIPAERDAEEWIRSIIDELNGKESISSPYPFREIAVRRPDGTDRIIEAKSFDFTAHGRTFYGGVVRDITERTEIEEAIRENEEKYRTFVEMSPDVIIIHQDGKIVYANPALEKLMIAGTPEDLIGMDVLGLIHPDFHEVVRRNTEDDLKGIVTPTTEVRIVRRDGSLVTFEGIGRRILYKGRPAVQVVIRDATERKAAEQQLREYADNLKRSNEDLELFAYIATHDLQEPIRNIVTYVQLLLSECGAGESPRTEKYLKIIENSGLRMNSLVSDLREYSRVRSQAKPPEPVDMGKILHNALNNLQPVITETRASITHDQLPVVLADSTQITQVVQNLIGNAIKFRRKETVPSIHVSVSSRDGMWQFGITDNGIGIPAGYYQKIFILFERLHSRDAYPGSGLGLALSKRVIERHGGQMWVESEVGVGSTFFFTLPAVSSSK